MNDLLEEFQELNLNNYDDDGVRRLNNWAIDAYHELNNLYKQLADANSDWQPIETAPKDEVVLSFVQNNYGSGYVCPIVYTKDKVWRNTSCKKFSEVSPVFWMPISYPSNIKIDKG